MKVQRRPLTADLFLEGFMARAVQSFSIALLRGINVGGHNKVAMSALRDLFKDLGSPGAQTLLQSGNVVFESPKLSGANLERLLEKETAARLAMTIDYVIRTGSEWAKIVAGNPFPDAAKNDPGHLVVMCLKSAHEAEKLDALKGAWQGREIIHGDGKQLYLVYPDGIGTSKLTGALLERQLGIRGTARNWNTVLKLAAMCEG